MATYISTDTRTVALPSGTEVTISRGERLDSRMWLDDDLAELEDRGFIYNNDDDDAPKAKPKRSRKPAAKAADEPTPPPLEA